METYDYKVRRKDYDKESEYYYALFKQAKIMRLKLLETRILKE